ncbi:MAG: TonB-dependent receptor, partial [Acidobacteria bacterium]|nr:TonB-dependent receptor [Acidobacteriota bacterium]
MRRVGHVGAIELQLIMAPSHRSAWSLSKLAFFGFLSLCASAQALEAATLRGRVVDQTGAAIIGAGVALYRPGQVLVAGTSTDERGEFVFGDLPLGSYEVLAQAPGMAPTHRALQVRGREAQPVEIVLHVGRVTTTVTVTPVRGEARNVLELPSEVNLVSGEKLAQRPGNLLAQGLREEVGVQIQQTSAHQAAVIIRGLTGQQVVHLVDGVRYNNSLFRPGPNQYFALLEPSFVDRVEIERGPNSAQYGSDSLGGTVNVLPVRPYFEPGARRFHGEVAPFFRSADLTGGASTRISYGTSRWNLF